MGKVTGGYGRGFVREIGGGTKGVMVCWNIYTVVFDIIWFFDTFY